MEKKVSFKLRGPSLERLPKEPESAFTNYIYCHTPGCKRKSTWMYIESGMKRYACGPCAHMFEQGQLTMNFAAYVMLEEGNDEGEG